MLYIFGLILTLGLIFSATTGTNLLGNLWNQTTDKAKELSFPKSEKEIAVDNLEAQHSVLDKFFSSTAPSLIDSDTIPEENKKALQEAVKVFAESQNTVEQIKTLEKENKGITKTIIEKVLNLDKKSEANPTHIPPNCNVVCDEVN